MNMRDSAVHFQQAARCRIAKNHHPWILPPRRVDALRLPPGRSAGLSLLEVVLALAILSIAAAYLSQSMRLSVQNAMRAQRLTRAELVAESVMNQVVAGMIPQQSVSWTPYTSPAGDTQWSYQVQTVQTEVSGMIGLQVAVMKNDPSASIQTTEYDLYSNRWIIDPSLGLDIPQEELEAGYGDESTSGSSSGGASGSGGASSPGSGAASGYGGGGFGGGGFGGAAGPRGGGGGGPGGGGFGGDGGRGGGGRGAGPPGRGGPPQ